jgi:hypothetical protein
VLAGVVKQVLHETLDKASLNVIVAHIESTIQLMDIIVEGKPKSKMKISYSLKLSKQLSRAINWIACYLEGMIRGPFQKHKSAISQKLAYHNEKVRRKKNKIQSTGG